MSKPQNIGDLAFTPAVKAVQERLGRRAVEYGLSV
jgi:hypothetical protein